MKRVKYLAMSALLCLGLAAGSASTVRAKADLSTTYEDCVISAEEKQNIKDISFRYAEVRTPSNSRVFNGGDGKYHVIVYGGVGSCGNTNSALATLSKMTTFMDLNEIELNVFDVNNNTAETILESLAANSISTDIKVCKTKGNQNLYIKCANAAGVKGSYTMPIIAYVNQNGDIVKATTGYAKSEEIQNNIKALGLEVNAEAVYQMLKITGTVDYEAAFKVLELLNADRAKENLPALVMDPGLLETAMQRAAECALYFDHTRPNGENCFSLDSKMYRENIAANYTTAEAVEAGWMASSGHHANIMSTDNKSVGVGAFFVNGSYYWVQCFGNAGSVNATKPANASRTYNIETIQDYVDPYLNQVQANLKKKGDTTQFEVYVKNKKWNSGQVRIDADSFIWSSDNTNFVVSADGKVTANMWGAANISVLNKNNTNYNLSATVTLSSDAKLSNNAIYLAEVSQNQVVAGMTYTIEKGNDVEFSWYVSIDGKNWKCIQDWKTNDEWIRWKPETYGEYQLKCLARVLGNSAGAVEAVTTVSFHPHIKGKCQMPYTGEGGGYLIGVETYDNPNQSYTYEMLILDCTLLAQGKDAWIYSTGRCGVAQGNALWTIWQPQYGYYWTLFRVYDADGTMIDEACYGFQNI